MNMDRAVLMGYLAEARQKKNSLAVKIAGALRSVQVLLAGAAVRKIEEIDIEAAALNLDEAVGLKKEFLAACETIAKLEKELS